MIRFHAEPFERLFVQTESVAIDAHVVTSQEKRVIH